jgi:hypothetical protein
MGPEIRRWGQCVLELDGIPLPGWTNEHWHMAEVGAPWIVGEPNILGLACAVCDEPVAPVRVRDPEGHHACLCTRCDWMMDWR